MPVYIWSKTSANNSSADPTINWAEGQAPSSVNDSARAMMSATAKYRDDITGALVTSGTSSAYTLTTNQGFDTLAHLHGQMVAFSPHTTNDAAPTLNVDGLGAAPLRSTPSTSLGAGVLLQGSPYVAIYNNTAGVFYLQGFYNVQNIISPVGVIWDYAGSTAPNSNFALLYGQALSRTTYSSLFSVIGTTFGAGNGTTTFNLPDLRGIVTAGLDNMGGTSADRLSSVLTSTGLGNTGGAQSVTLTQAQLPAIKPGITITDPGHTHPFVGPNDPASGAQSASTPVVVNNTTRSTSSATTGITAAFTNNLGSGNAHSNVQPTMVLNKIMRVI